MMCSSTLLARVAAEKYKPAKTHVLFVAESPPLSADRYFYFEDVKGHDWLWIGLMRALYPDFKFTKEQRLRKRLWLSRFRKSGYQLVDAVKEPLSGSHRKRVARIRADAPALIAEIREIRPNHVVLIKTSVYEALFQRLRDAGLPVANEGALPFPAAGQQTRFQEGLRRLRDSGRFRIAPVSA